MDSRISTRGAVPASRGPSGQSREEARTAIFEYIEVFYNRQRLHQTLNYLAPAEYERRAGILV